MSTRISIPAIRGLAEVMQALPVARLVGGVVRDCLAGVPMGDIDIATPATPEQVIEFLTAAHLRAVPTGLAHGTVTAVSKSRGFEITTLRRDLHTDGRHAVVEFCDDWQIDAARRDFTINAMSADFAGQVYDYFGGVEDLAAGRVRFVGNPRDRIAEDYLRILRFFRFFARFGRTPPDAESMAALNEGAPNLTSLSVERIWHELRGILSTAAPLEAVTLMQKTAVLAVLFPQTSDLATFTRLLAKNAPPNPLLRLSALTSEDEIALAQRLKFSRAEATTLIGLRHGIVPDPSMQDGDLRRLLADEEAEILCGRVWLGPCDAPQSLALTQRILSLPKPEFPLRGNDGLALGAKPGRRLGQALAATRAWWLETGCTADHQTCRTHLAGILSQNQK